jgi:hypothetical protein
MTEVKILLIIPGKGSAKICVNLDCIHVQDTTEKGSRRE